jgi:hypothetical protein
MNLEYLWLAFIAGTAMLALVVVRRRHAEYKDLLREQAFKRKERLRGGFSPPRCSGNFWIWETSICTLDKES